MFDISVIIPTYKPQSYLDACLASLAQQTFSANSFEVIIVLNGCNEPYKSEVEKWMAKYPYLNFCFLQTDQGGVSNARNIGLDNAKGSYICFVDDDDCISPTYLQQLFLVAKDNIIVASNVLTFTENYTTEVLGEDYLSTAFKKHKASTWIDVFNGRSFLSTSCCKLIPRLVIGSRRFNTHYKLGEDALFMALLSDKIKKIKLASADAIYYRRIRVNSASRTKQSAWNRFRNMLNLSISYFFIYINKPLQYNLFFFLSRPIAIFKSWLGSK